MTAFQIKAYAAALLGPFLAAALVDVNGWLAARKLDRTAKFDWSVAVPRWEIGLIVGFMALLGVSQA